MLILNRLRFASSLRRVCGLGLYVGNEQSVLKHLPSTSGYEAFVTVFTLNGSGSRCSSGVCSKTLRFLERFKPTQIPATSLLKRRCGMISRTFCTVLKKLNCWKCEAPLQTPPAFFCQACLVIQPPDENINFFDIMDCEISFALDVRKLQKRYMHLQRSLHPDNFSQKTQQEQEYSESQSALVNRAYRTLLKPLSRGLYMLELEGIKLEGDPDCGLSLEFLQDILEMSERLAETQSQEEASDIWDFVRGKLENLIGEINKSFSEGDLNRAKVLLAEMKYFANIEEKVKDKVSQIQ
ncbi:HSC20 protein, partial [Atractosteus spatula]|nr:HSC20 protein [Atractosteus spatula]